MKKKFLSFAVITAFVCTGAILTSCDDDDDKDSWDFDSTITFENVGEEKDFVQSGTFRMEGTAQPVILPGESLSFKFNAGKGQALMFATMYGYSNDMFFAPENPGIALFSANGTPVTGDVSSQVKLWDNGTRINQAPGAEVTHPGTADNGNVTMISGTDAQGHTYLAASELMRLELAYNQSHSEFTMTITNISGGKANATPFSPGVWAVSNMSGGKLVNETPFFTSAQKATTQLSALAESGNVQPLADMVEDKTGIVTGLSPAIVVIYTGDTNPLFTVNQKDGGNGLKELAQTGNTTRLKEHLERERLVRRVYVVGTQPITPGQKMEIQFDASQNERIAFATMFGASNDWFFANNTPISANTVGDITDKVTLYDNGTAVNQYPGAGNHQAGFGGTNEVEDKVITPVDNTFPIPKVSDMIKVTIR